jgi:hypothetical protein
VGSFTVTVGHGSSDDGMRVLSTGSAALLASVLVGRSCKPLTPFLFLGGPDFYFWGHTKSDEHAPDYAAPLIRQLDTPSPITMPIPDC